MDLKKLAVCLSKRNFVCEGPTPLVGLDWLRGLVVVGSRS